MVSKKTSSFRPELDLPSRESGLGGDGTSTYTIFNGLNIQGGRAAVPPNVDDQGLVFFTKPAMNLSYDNVSSTRMLSVLKDYDVNSISNAIRCMLCPEWIDNNAKLRDDINKGMARSAITDDKNPFLTVLSNSLQSLSGWPDWSVDSYTSNEGYMKEQVSWVDDTFNIYNTFDLTSNFYNMEGNPVLDIVRIWLEYATRVSTGEMGPDPWYIVANRIDYQSKIYRFTLDRSRTFVQKAGCTIAYPIAVPNGASYNYADDKPYNDDNAILSIPWRCIGAEYDDPIIIKEFNRTVSRFNPSMKEAKLREYRLATLPSGNNKRSFLEMNEVRITQPMVKLVDSEKQLYNYKAYPHISESNELEWWVFKEDYDKIQNLIKNNDDKDIGPKSIVDDAGNPVGNLTNNIA